MSWNRLNIWIINFETELKLQGLFLQNSITVAVMERSCKGKFFRQTEVWLQEFRGLLEQGWGAAWALRARAPTACWELGHRGFAVTTRGGWGQELPWLSCLRFSVLDPTGSLDKADRVGVVKREICINVLPSRLVCTSVYRFIWLSYPLQTGKEDFIHPQRKRMIKWIL